MRQPTQQWHSLQPSLHTHGALCRWPEQWLAPDAPGRAAGAPCSCLHAVQREQTIPRVGRLWALVAGNPIHTHMCHHTTPSCGFLTSQAAALGQHLARQFPGLLSASSSQRPLVHCSTAVRAARTAAIALAQFPGPGQGPASTGQQQLPAVVQSSSELLELSQGSWVSLAGCVSMCW